MIKQLEDTQRENYEATEHLRRELLLKIERIAELDQEVLQVRSAQVYLPHVFGNFILLDSSLSLVT